MRFKLSIVWAAIVHILMLPYRIPWNIRYWRREHGDGMWQCVKVGLAMYLLPFGYWWLGLKEADDGSEDAR